jgi:carboxyl-terminal processing protease
MKKIILALSTFLAISVFANSDDDKQQTRFESYAKFIKVVEMVRAYYVDEITLSDIIDKSIEGLLPNLDAHSSYLDKKGYKNLKVETSGEFGGLGITVGLRNGALTVISPIDDTPAYKVGIKAGDIILKINSKSTIDMTLDEAVSLMRGKPKTSITLTIVRKGEQEPLVKTIIRDIIKVKSVKSKDIDEFKNIQYIRISSFDKNVVSELHKVLKNMKDKKGIILDLRNNPGGLLSQAVGVVDTFVSNGVIVSQKGRIRDNDDTHYASAYGTYKDIPIVVLINGGSASASEIVSGALQDHRRAIIIGEKSFGKGSVQAILPISKDEAIRLTIARYYLPSGRTIQAVGVTPDIIVKSGIVQDSNKTISIKESELKAHLESELEKVDNNTTKKSEKEDKNILKVNGDIQLKTAGNILQALIISKQK